MNQEWPPGTLSSVYPVAACQPSGQPPPRPGDDSGCFLGPQGFEVSSSLMPPHPELGRWFSSLALFPKTPGDAAW